MEDEFVKISAVDNFTNSPDFEVPIYNVWKQQTKTAGVNHFGNSEVRWLDNLLYLYQCPAPAPARNSLQRPAEKTLTALLAEPAQTAFPSSHTFCDSARPQCLITRNIRHFSCVALAGFLRS